MNRVRMDRDRWAQLSICEQMGNIGSEVGRAINAKRNNMSERVEGAINRALDLFSATVEVLLREGTHKHRVREVLRARDEFLALFYDDRFDEADKIEEYFMHFALAARRQHQRRAIDKTKADKGAETTI
jgi:hypothetical protein